MIQTTYTIEWPGVTVSTTDARQAEQASHDGATVTASTRAR
jgi:hypothetical protein